ncbi:MAG TPA: thiamine-phosphate kinase [Gemmatimonadales bacterium]|jgi:thiamine-monophosphate kinase|nr:thiamine-phosphate kinase [Gemmatimonadales bacterium]
MSSSLPLGPGAEFDRLRAIFARLGADASGVGDDCALLSLGNTTLAVSIDCSLEGVHFRTDWLTFEEIGWRAAAAALSDLAADGAEPLGVLVSLGMPGRGKRDTGNVDPGVEIMAGVAAAAGSVGAKVLGGDLVRSETYVVDVCVLGTAKRPVRRTGAQAGDGLWVTGTLGGAALALAGLRAGTRPAGALGRRYLHPEPRVAAGQWLAAHGATAMLDVSDGLAADAGHLAAASGVGLEIALERLPCWDGVAPLAAAASGEEFELLVTLPVSFTETPDFQLTRIGTCFRGAGVRLLEGTTPVALPAGYDHFAP